MKNSKKAYYIFYFSFVLVILAAIFLDKYLLIYFKPLSLISLTFLYCTSVKKINWIYPLSMSVIMLTSETLVYIDFLKYFDVISIITAGYFGMSIYLLKNYIGYDDFKVKKIISVPVIASMFLIIYLMYEIVNLGLPGLVNFLFYFITVVISLTLFVCVCFFIYVNDKYAEGVNLFIASYCCLFVNALLLVNELYYYSTVFTVLINIVEMSGFYLFLKFLIDVQSDEKASRAEGYL